MNEYIRHIGNVSRDILLDHPETVKEVYGSLVKPGSYSFIRVGPELDLTGRVIVQPEEGLS